MCAQTEASHAALSEELRALHATQRRMAEQMLVCTCMMVHTHIYMMIYKHTYIHDGAYTYMHDDIKTHIHVIYVSVTST